MRWWSEDTKKPPGLRQILPKEVVGGFMESGNLVVFDDKPYQVMVVLP